MLYHIHLCVCLSIRLSVTLRYCVKTRECREMRSSPSSSPVSLVFWCQEWLPGNEPVQVNFECKRLTPCENNQAVHISPHNSRTIIDTEKSPIKVNRKSTMGFPTSHQPRSCVTANFPKMGFTCRNLSFFAEISTKKSLKVCYKVLLSKNFLWQSCNAINYLYRTVSTVWQSYTIC